MKILIVSDSHGQTDILHKLKARYASEMAAMIHCGDSELNNGDEAIEGFTYVRGNCDYDSAFPNERTEEIGGYRFFITHGHLYNIKMNLQSITYKAEEAEAQFVCFGHSHHAGSMQGDDGLIYINPGSISLPRGRKEKSFAILEIEDSKANVQFLDDEGKTIQSLSASYKIK
ncbi:metallophosphoesterase family protein [Bacillus sp. 1P06AnD]|uniref:metallophosphoesterase family protein n=1 Tax=Bacillus sp. 1P06AnD TaxID=3132208 RepID=UPI0039A10B9F